MEKIFEGKSLRFICNAINMGLGLEEYEVENLRIVSAQKPHLIIKVLDIDISEFVLEQLAKQNIGIGKNITHAECNYYGFVIFTTAESDESGNGTETLMVLSLLDMVLMNEKTLSDETGMRTESGSWSLDSEEWDLLAE